MAALDQAVERLEHELLALLDEVEDLLAEDEEAAIDPDVGLLAGTDALHRSRLVELCEMKADRRMNRDEAGDLAALLEALDHLRQGSVGQAVAVIGEEHLLVLDEMFDREQSFAD